MKFHFILPWAMLSFLVFVIQPLIKSQTHGQVNFVGGGMNVDERGMRADYNLSLLFLIQGTEEYLGALEGSNKDTHGNTFPNAMFNRLILFPEFKPGRNITSVDQEGQWIDKIVNVGGKTAASSPFTGPRQAEHAALDLPGR